MKTSAVLPLLAALAFLHVAQPAELRAQQARAAAPVLMLSDIHLDPYHDPAKFPALLDAPAAGWAAIFDAPASATRAADFDKLQAACGSKGVDTPIALLESALTAMHAQQPAPLFVTVSGDLMAHQFDCRFHTLAALVPSRKLSDADYSAFAAKTVAFVALQLHLAYPKTPVYFALGNNDSGCRDYDEDPDSAFLQADGKAFAADAINAANADAVAKQFSMFGDYNVALPIPHTRLLVMQDIFESKKYTSCDGKANPDPAAAQVAWLRAQLTAARAAHEHVWVMAHIPPGIDAYSTFTKGKDVCAVDAKGKQVEPELFLNSGALADAITDFPDVIRLATFGHTHMDEMRVYAPSAGGAAFSRAPIPGKLVPSISPVNGNTPAFTLAQVDRTTATLLDYTVYTAVGAPTAPSAWAAEYSFSATYHQPDLSGASLSALLTAFVADKPGSTAAAVEYQRLFSAGAADPAGNGKASVKAAAMKLVWPIYACSMSNATSAGFYDCMCGASSK